MKSQKRNVLIKLWRYESSNRFLQVFLQSDENTLTYKGITAFPRFSLPQRLDRGKKEPLAAGVRVKG
jgi:hypothetical protein